MKKNIFKMQINLFLYVIGLVTRFEIISFEILEVLCITISRMTVQIHPNQLDGPDG